MKQTRNKHSPGVQGQGGPGRPCGGDDDPMRVKTLPIIREGVIRGALEVGQSEDDVSETLSSLLLIMAVAYPITLVVAGFGGLFLAGRALSPIDRISKTVHHISAEHLDQRLNLRLPDDEVGRLAQTFDEMIARLDNAFKRQRQFTADASHELRTPLTIIKGQIDVSLQKDREPEAYRQVLQAVNEEVDRGHHLHPHGEGLPVPGGHHGLAQPARAGLEALQHHGHQLLRGERLE